MKRPHTHRTGLGLIEAMIALVICAALLTAVSGAFVASANGINENDEFFRATQAGRVALNRILTQVRRGSVDETSTSDDLHLITDTSADINYTYDPESGRILLVTNSDLTDPNYVLARNVTAAQFLTQMGTDFAGNACVARVSVQITVTVGNNTVLFSGSAAPRRNLSF